MGASGAGKSTLLQLLGGLDKPTNGQILIKGTDVSKVSTKKLGLLRNQYLSQGDSLVSKNKLYKATLQHDGNFVIYNSFGKSKRHSGKKK